MRNPALRQALAGLFMLVMASAGVAQSPQPAIAAPFPLPEKLDYRIEWRLITAGMATVKLSRSAGNLWETNLKIESAGFVTKLYRVLDTYRALTNDQFCGVNTTLDAQEGKRHKYTVLSFDNGRHKVQYEERDLLKNKSTTKALDVPPCTHEIVGALSAFRMMRLEPGKSASIPVTDGKKVAMARVEAQERETITIDKKDYHTIRYEAFLFDNVLYQRKGRLWIWMTDDASRLPVQIRVRLGFPIGNITLFLDKEEH
ncbi:MAG TPA: DUF3108 domain-containing protein [Bryobacteraceae bacterium]|nr:DUF3108 domain-containing protein [Bryobacteraceae bacterium]